MPPAQARRLAYEDDMPPRPGAAPLHLLPVDAAFGEPSPSGSLQVSIPGRPHPRSRIRPESCEPSPVLERNEARVAAAAAPRTIVVTGQRTPATRAVAQSGRATASGRVAGAARSPGLAQVAARPDRLALWAVGLGLLMAFMAAATAEAAAPSAPVAAPVAASR